MGPSADVIVTTRCVTCTSAALFVAYHCVCAVQLALALLREDKKNAWRRQTCMHSLLHGVVALHVHCLFCAGSASGPTTDPVLIQLQQSFIPDASNMQASGISPSFYITPQDVLTSTFTAHMGWLVQSNVGYHVLPSSGLCTLAYARFVIFNAFSMSQDRCQHVMYLFQQHCVLALC